MIQVTSSENALPVRMHADEIDIDVALVCRLVSERFPQWAGLPITPVESAGTDNAIYRLGTDMAVRLPRVPSATGQVGKEYRWLPKLAPHLPLAVPVPIVIGSPTAGYPWSWSVCRWLEGETATSERLADLDQAATDLAHFITALQRSDPADGPSTDRGAALATRDDETRAAIDSLDGVVDKKAVTAAWEAALDAPPWQGPPVWLHGDLYDGNLLASGGRLSAVIDFGTLGVGDPASDLIVAWSLLSGTARETFRRALQVDGATWARGKGWALSVALIALPYYRETNPVMVANSLHRVAEVLADHAGAHGA